MKTSAKYKAISVTVPLPKADQVQVAAAVRVFLAQKR
jgi:hypothetical protein